MYTFKKIGRAVSTVSLAAVSCLLSSEVVGAQDSSLDTVRPKVFAEAQIAGIHDGYQVRVFVASGHSLNDPDARVYHEPLIYVVQRVREGELLSSFDDEGGINLYVRWGDPQVTKLRIKEYFRERGYDVGNWTVEPLTITDGWFHSKTQPEVIRSGSLPANSNFSERGETQVHFKLETRIAAEEFLANLQSEPARDTLVFTYRFAGKSAEVCFADAQGEEVENLDRTKRLVGPAGERYVSRKQVADIAREAATVLRAKSECPDPALASQMVQQVISQVNNLGGKYTAVDYETLAGFATLNEDLKTTFIQTLDEVRNQLEHNKDREAFEEAQSSAKESGVSGGFKGMAAAASSGISRASSQAQQKFVERLEESGVRLKFEGGKYIPKDVDVYTKEGVNSVLRTGVSMKLIVPKDGSGRFPITLTKSSWDAPMGRDRFDFLRNETAEVIARLERLEKALRVEIHQSKEEMRSVIGEASKKLSGDLAASDERVWSVQGLGGLRGWVQSLDDRGIKNIEFWHGRNGGGSLCGVTYPSCPEGYSFVSNWKDHNSGGSCGEGWLGTICYRVHR